MVKNDDDFERADEINNRKENTYSSSNLSAFSVFLIAQVVSLLFQTQESITKDL